MTEKIKMKCTKCGSTDVRKDAWAEWDEDLQDWVLGSVFDEAFCFKCDGPCSIEEEDVAE